jgi:hypothetical protein
MKTYDPKRYDLVLGGVRLNQGLADGTWITVEGMSPGFTSKVGVDGEVTRARMHDRRATVRLTVMQTSAVNDLLSRQYLDDRNGNENGRGVASFLLQDRAGTTVVQASKAYIADDPDVTLSAEAETREWVIELADAEMFHGGNPDD